MLIMVFGLLASALHKSPCILLKVLTLAAQSRNLSDWTLFSTRAAHLRGRKFQSGGR